MILGDFQILNIITGGKWKQNCYVVQHIDTKETVIIDPGANEQDIIERIDQLGGKIKYLLLTHAHHDHMGAAEILCDRYGVKCLLHKLDEKLLRHAPLFSVRFAGRTVKVPKNVELYENDIDIAIADEKIDIIHTPGHSSGSVCILFNKFIFTGDTLLYKSIGRTDLPGGNEHELLRSIIVLKNRMPDGITVFSGHGESFTSDMIKEWLRKNGTDPDKIDRYRAFEQ